MKAEDEDRLRALMGDGAVQELAREVAAYYQALRDAGMTPVQAFALTESLHLHLMCSVFGWGEDEE